MPFAANPLLSSPAAAASKAAAGKAAPPADSGGQKFSRVYAKASDTVFSKAPESAAKGLAGAGKSSTVADSGKSLPAGKAKEAADTDLSTTTPGDTAPVPDPVATAPVVDSTEPAPSVETTPVDAQAPPSPAMALIAAAQVQPEPVVDDTAEPPADPLDDLPALRLAMEQGGHISAASKSPAKAGGAENMAANTQGPVASVALLIDTQADSSEPGEGGEKAFKGLVDDGLKDLKSAASDTRVDDFANRLAALTQAAVPKTANALPINQPLAMHQSGWSEEVVNRVMYLSSANLKSADIQLEPAELGRLDIRVNISADQAAQVNFVSGHAGVREALDSQMHRLREMFAQQGMGQVDVNVSDQSRNWQGQGQEQQARNSAGGQRLESGAGEDHAVAAAEPVAPSVVLGSSAVDYYA
ncbi:flagellar hook-length control protein FliK [Pseudomonas helleri]|uniref:flagellar hook-length control protein FliK n=1 Tax=Pseudomonas helleri TaxID=1608996 RepID=UPI0037C5E4D3